MNNQANKEMNKYFVIKNADLENYFEHFCPVDKKDDLVIAIQEVVEGIKDMRKKLCKTPDNKYIVCNQDEPYADDVWDVILKGEDEKQVEKI